MSVVTVHHGNINSFFNRSPLAGAGVGGLRSGTAERVAARMVLFVERECAKDFRTGGGPGRSGELIRSFRPIIRPDPRGGVRVGVGSVSKTAEYLTKGTRGHEITPRVKDKFRTYPLKSAPGHPQPLVGYPIFKVKHPGNKPNDFIRRGVNLAIGRPVL